MPCCYKRQPYKNSNEIQLVYMTLSDRGSALEQIHQLFLAHAGDDSLVIVNNGVAEVLLQTLQLHDFLLSLS